MGGRAGGTVLPPLACGNCKDWLNSEVPMNGLVWKAAALRVIPGRDGSAIGYGLDARSPKTRRRVCWSFKSSC